METPNAPSQAILKYSRSVIRQSKADGERFRNVIIHGKWDPKAKLRKRRLQKNVTIRDSRLPWWSNDDVPSLAPSVALDIPPQNDDDYPVSDASTSDDEECYTSTPMYDRADRLLDPKEAYFWFNLVHISLHDHACADYKLDPMCSPLVLVAMVHVGWVSVSDATSFAESRQMLGEGLIRANMVRNLGRYGCLVDRMKEMGKPGYLEMKRNHLNWELARDPKKTSKTYDWKKDQFERIVNGPFGTALEKYAPPEELEGLLSKMLHTLPSGIQTYPKFDAVLDPLVSRRRTEEESRLTRTTSWFRADADVSMCDVPGSTRTERSKQCRPPKDPNSPFEFFFADESEQSDKVMGSQRYHPYRPALKKHKARRRQQCLGETR